MSPLQAFDPGATGTSGARVSADPKVAIRAAAKQFEALFMQQLMKSMRESSLASSMLDSPGSQLGTEMLDSQYANRMSGLPGGLGDLIARQLERQIVGSGNAPALAAVLPANAAGAPRRVEPLSAADSAAGTPGQQEFVRLHDASARAAQAATGIPAGFMVAQAAHESGWGRREIRHGDGSSAHNLFGIKAGAGWSGPTAQVMTTEVVDGEPRKVLAKFRAYASHRESFEDYARLMKGNPRYAPVVAAGNDAQQFAHGLQRAGYATDPAYADKLGRVINATLRLQRAATHAAGSTA